MIRHMNENVRMRFDHVSFAVRSIDRAVEFFSRYFPMEERNPKTRDDQVSGAFYWQDFWLGGFVVEFIEEVQPDICISGHIHESAAEDVIGATKIFNAGPFKGGGYIVANIEGKSVNARLEFL